MLETHLPPEGDRQSPAEAQQTPAEGDRQSPAEAQQTPAEGGQRNTSSERTQERAQRSPKEVVEDHLSSISSRDPESMAADYAADAILSRDRLYVGHSAILSYFRGVPDRLGEGNVVFGQRKQHSDGRISVGWKIAGGQADGLAGTDTYTLAGGMIIHQVVELDGADF